jgi:16S rRNA processing protein RimM
MIEVGRILRPRGLKGEVKAECSSEERLRELKAAGKVLFEKNGKQSILVITDAIWQSGFAYFKFDGIASVEAAEDIRDGLLLVEKERLATLPEGSYYQFELVGFEILSDIGEVIGKVVDVIDYPTCDALEVKLRNGGFANMPMTKAVIGNIDKSTKQITVNSGAIEELL